MQGYGLSRRALFERTDQLALQPLPHYPFVFASWKKAKVNVDYHISGQLHIQGTGQPQILLLPAAETEFFARALEFRIVFNTALDGTVESATLLQNGQELPAPKVD